MTQDIPENPEPQPSILDVLSQPILVGGFLNDAGIAVGKDLGNGNIAIPNPNPS